MAVDVKKYNLVIDIGKTHAKLHVLNHHLESVHSKQVANIVEEQSRYPSVNTSSMWLWLTTNIKEISGSYSITSITITTHGATAALIDKNSSAKDGLVLPMLDYEYEGINSINVEYDRIRPNFDDTYSPCLPAGLNLGRQLYWLKQAFPEEFASVTDILMYPQYWMWRFTGQCLSEITSLGCHTDLWSIKQNDYSSLVDTLACKHLFPPIQPAWFNCGQVKPKLQEELGLNDNCKVFSGIHDSNASFLRYKLNQKDSPFTVISTGTWTILMSSQASLDQLKANKDMLANIDAMGHSIPCARFMGGREFELICAKLGCELDAPFDELELQQVIDEQVFALPDFSGGSGPFGSQMSGFLGDVNNIRGNALASLYCALMIDYQLDELNAKGPIFIEGAFLKNPLLCAIVNQLRSDQDIFLSTDTTGTVKGAAYLSQWGANEYQLELVDAKTTLLSGLSNYKSHWLTYISPT